MWQLTDWESTGVGGQLYIDGLVQDCSNFSVLAMVILQSCMKPSVERGAKIIGRPMKFYVQVWLVMG